MGWQDLLGGDDSVVVPWTGGRALVADGRSWRLDGPLPDEHGWHEVATSGGRRATWLAAAETDAATWFAADGPRLRGYVLGDRLIPDGAAVRPDVEQAWAQSLPLHLVEPGLPRFARASAARWADGRWIYVTQEFPLGPEFGVLEAWQDRLESIDHVPGVPPALDLAFRWLGWQRDRAAQRREELRLQREQEERRRRMEELTGTGRGRRELALLDFAAAARAALAVSGAELLDEREARTEDERVVQFRLDGRRFECVVERASLRVIDAGICLEDHYTGERGDDRFTLESLPAVISEAVRTGQLHVYRHLDEG